MAGLRRGRTRRRRALGGLLAAVLLVAPGCRSLGVGASWAHDWGSGAFAANPASVGFYYTGMGLAFVATSPLILLAWPLSALLYPDNEQAFYGYSVTSPGHYLGVVLGTLLAAPFYPLGLPWMPDEPPPPAGPAPAQDLAAQDAPAEDGPTQDGPAEDGPAEDGPAQDEGPQ